MRDEPEGFHCGICKRDFPDDQYDLHVPPHKPMIDVVKNMDPEDSTFIPEIVPDEVTGQMVDASTGRKYRKPFQQSPYKPLSDFEGS